MKPSPRYSGRPLPAAQATASVGSPKPAELTNVPPTLVAVGLLGVTFVLVWVLFRSTRATREQESRIANLLEEPLADSERAWMEGAGVQWPRRRSWRDYRSTTACLVTMSALALFLFRDSSFDSLRAPTPMLVLALEALAILVTCSLFFRHLIRVERIGRIHSEVRRWASDRNSAT